MDTIFSLASAAGKAGVSVIRISGPDALIIAEKMGVKLARHDRKVARLIGSDGSLIDEAFVLSFAPGHSFTGEQVVEFQTHGSPAIISAVVRELSYHGGRQSEAGEFTRRAMESGVLDLARVEGLADLIDAETESQRQQAIRVFQGELGNLAQGWRQKLVRAAALLEATIDFVDEDVPIDVRPEVQDLVSKVCLEVEREAAGVAIRERVRDGFEIALIGPPNAGKSSLLNRLAGRDAALTSDIAGTTRDVIEVKMDLDGLPVTILDTAGIRDSTDTLEEMGIERGVFRALNADVRIHLTPDGKALSLGASRGSDIVVRPKSDLGGKVDCLSISSKTGDGIEDLLKEISEYLKDRVASAGVACRERHERSLSDAVVVLKRVLTGLEADMALVDLLADDLRQSIRSLDALIGRVDVENLLDEIFSSFCIGK